MTLYRFRSGAQLLDMAAPMLEADEAENNLLLDSAHRVKSAPERFQEPPYLAVATRDRRVYGAAVRAGSGRLLLSRAPDWALALVANDLRIAAVPGVFAVAETARLFAKQWLRLASGAKIAATRDLRLHDLRAMVSTPEAPGQLRPVDVSEEYEVDMIHGWVEEFLKTTGLTGVASEVATRAIQSGRLHVWDDGIAVSMASWSARTRRCARINLVYTPELLRSRGYASACVAGLTRKLLAEGCEHVCLFTDPGDAIANRLYRRLGYRPVADFTEIDFRRD